MSLDKKDILKLANLAKLAITPEEVEQYQQQLKEVLDYVDQLKELNLATVDASLSGVESGQYQLRADQVGSSQAEMMTQAAEVQDGYMVSPGVLKK